MELLHGTLQCTIFRAENLVNEFRFTGTAPRGLRKVVGLVEKGVHLGRGPSRLYATVDLEKTRVGRTRMIEGEPVNPTWDESFQIYCAHWVSHVVITVKDNDTVGSHVLGRARIEVSDLKGGEIVDSWLDLHKDDGTQMRGGGRVRVRMQFRGVDKDRATEVEVKRAYYRQRKGCDVRLYQDAHMLEGFMPEIFLSGGKLMEAAKCWDDIFAAVTGAELFVYIAGWSVFTEVELRRGGGAGTLGELLKWKAQAGVAVLLLVWDDITSVRSAAPAGLMKTHDEETFAYFRGSKVKCVRCNRIPDSSLSVAQGFQISTMFTHHQKLLCCDAAVSALPASTSSAAIVPNSATAKGSTFPHTTPDYTPSHLRHLRRHFACHLASFRHSSSSSSSSQSFSGPRRQVVSFIGGIDLCNGRYDDQRHSLFRTLHLEHADDFHQPSFKKVSLASGGPREPWHDIHCRILGPAAWDVLDNFEQRWRRQASAGALLDLGAHPRLLPASTPALPEDSSDSWNVQLFRSIDAGAAFGFPQNPADAAELGLVSGKDNIIERSIHDAYVHSIRRAKSFIYIENQYFLGSSHAWAKNTDVGCSHLVPIEIALKIVSKIEADERFVAYVVLPMWPEGPPESYAVQAILRWQRMTMKMMYKLIASALQAAGKTEEQPTDYLTFFCLGNREASYSDEPSPEAQISENSSHHRLAQENRRFMIYVHSKLMIVDDEYIILGSANINQRSMDGGRDTEIAIGAYQLFDSEAANRGQVHGFRMSLWYEHLGHLNNVFMEPCSLECVRHVNQAAKETWNLFAGERIDDLPGHLLAYPIDVSPIGVVKELPGQPFFPDTKARVLGKQTPLPPILTT